MYTNINSSSPLKHDFPMLDGAMRLARRGQPTIVTPFTLSGAMAPVTIAGAVAQQTAEALCVIALLQVHPAGPAGGLRLLHVERRHEVGRARLRHAGIRARDADFRADGALLRPAAPRLQRLRRECSGRAGGVGERQLALGLHHRQGERRLSRRRLAGGRADRLLRKVRHRLRDAAAGDPLHEADRHDRRRHRGRRDRARSGRAAISSAPSTRRRATRRRSTARSSPTGGTTRRGSSPARCRRRSAPTRSGSRSWPSSSRLRMDPAIEEELREFVERRKREGGAPTDF